MAIYLGRYFSSGKGKLGGLVLSGTNAVPTLRSRAVPIAPSSAGQLAQQAQVASTPAAWLSQYAQFAYGWQADASWITYGDGPDYGVYISPATMFTSAQSNAALLGTIAYPSADGFPATNPAITAITLSGAASGNTVAAAFASGAAYAYPWLLYLTAYNPMASSTPATTGGLFLGGSLSGTPVSVQASLTAELGVAPAVGDVFGLYAVTTYETDLITGLPYGFNVATGA